MQWSSFYGSLHIQFGTSSFYIIDYFHKALGTTMHHYQHNPEYTRWEFCAFPWSLILNWKFCPHASCRWYLVNLMCKGLNNRLCPVSICDRELVLLLYCSRSCIVVFCLIITKQLTCHMTKKWSGLSQYAGIVFFGSLPQCIQLSHCIQMF